MAIPKRKFAALCLSVLLSTGCTSIKVIRNPEEGDTGVRFYRPKPYLLVTPADPTGRLVNMKLEYLPDFNEEYSAHIKGKASVALKDGWNLVGVNTKDAPKEEDKPPAKIEDLKLPGAVVSATNVPMGYYESVYGFSGEKKFLQGWRYVGMTVLGGNQPNVCRVAGHSPNCPPGSTTAGCINGPLYGLVFFNGVMTFRQLDEIANNQLCPMYVNPTPAETSPTTSPDVPIRTVPDVDPATPKRVVPSTITPPIPAPVTPPPSTSLLMPKVTPALAIVPPVVAPNAPLSRPVVTLAKPIDTPIPAGPSTKMPAATPALANSANAGKPATSQGSYIPLAKKATAPATVAPTDLLKTASARKAAVTPPSLDQDPLAGTSPSLDQDLFRTGSSPRR